MGNITPPEAHKYAAHFERVRGPDGWAELPAAREYLAKASLQVSCFDALCPLLVYAHSTAVGLDLIAGWSGQCRLQVTYACACHHRTTPLTSWCGWRLVPKRRCLAATSSLSSSTPSTSRTATDLWPQQPQTQPPGCADSPFLDEFFLHPCR